jgi:hypothetical protein
VFCHAGLEIAGGARSVETNILYANLKGDQLRAGVTAADVSAALKAGGILCSVTSPTRFRLVTNYHVSAADVTRTLDSLRQIMASLSK